MACMPARCNTRLQCLGATCCHISTVHILLLQVSKYGVQTMGCYQSASSIMWLRHATADALLRGLLKSPREPAYWPQISLGQNILCSAWTRSAVQLTGQLLQGCQLTASVRGPQLLPASRMIYQQYMLQQGSQLSTRLDA